MRERRITVGLQVLQLEASVASDVPRIRIDATKTKCPGRKVQVPWDSVRVLRADAVDKLALALLVCQPGLPVRWDLYGMKPDVGRLDVQVNFPTEARRPLLELALAPRVEVEQYHEVVERVDQWQVLEHDPVLCLEQELPDAIVREIVAILRPEAFVHNDESIPVDLLEQTVVVPVPDDVGVLDPLEPGRITGELHAHRRQAEHLLD